MASLVDNTGWTVHKHKGIVLFDASTELEEIKNMKVRDDDVWVCTFPRSGTTLTQEIVYLIQTMDFEKARTVLQEYRSPYIDILHPNTRLHFRGVKYVEAMSSPRVIKSHLHYFLLPDELKSGKGKIVYVTRNPNACALSYYNLTKCMRTCQAESLRDYMDLFLKDEVFQCPWWLHVLQYWEHRNDDNTLFLTYEDLVQDKKSHIRKLADFLGKAPTEEEVAKIDDHTDIENMRNNPSTNYDWQFKTFKTNDQFGGYINQGLTDGWRNVVPDDIQKKMKAMLLERLGHTDLTF